MSRISGDGQKAAAVRTFVEEQKAREDVIILEVAAIDPDVFGNAEKAVVLRLYPEVKAGDTVTFLFDDGNTETAVAGTDGSVEVTFRQAGVFAAFRNN